MIIRRYYKKGVKYPYTICDEYLNTLLVERGQEEANRLDNASYELILDTKEERINWFNDCLNRVYNNPRFYLDNLDKLYVFNVKIKEIFPKRKNFIN